MANILLIRFKQFFFFGKPEFEPTKAGDLIGKAPLIYHEKSFFHFGGYSFDEASGGWYVERRIGRMDLDGQWTDAGKMNQARYGHNVIYNGFFIMVIGGRSEDNYFRGEVQTERCSIINGSFSCFSQTPELKDYFGYPELFLVPDDFCK